MCLTMGCHRVGVAVPSPQAASSLGAHPPAFQSEEGSSQRCREQTTGPAPWPLAEPRCDRGAEGHLFAVGALVPLRLSAFLGWELCCVYLVSHAPGTFKVASGWVQGDDKLCFLEPS